MTYTFTVEISDRETEGKTTTELAQHIEDTLQIYSKFDILNVEFQS